MRARILLCAAGLLLGGVGVAGAHAFLDHADPRVGSTVKVAPRELRLWFTDDLDVMGCAVSVSDARGEVVKTGKPVVDAKDTMRLDVALPALGAGKYRVAWQATCDYGHVTKGDFAFVVKP